MRIVFVQHFSDNKHVCATIFCATIYPTTSTIVRQFFQRQARLCDKVFVRQIFPTTSTFVRQFFVRQGIFTTIFCATHFLSDKFTVNWELRRERLFGLGSAVNSDIVALV